jgi:transglutaminase-like putative cysteine protease
MSDPLSRRDFLRYSGIAAASAALPFSSPVQSHLRASSPAQSELDSWRVFEIVTRVQVLEPKGQTRVWLPTPLATAPYQHTLGDTYRAEGGKIAMVERNDLDMLAAEWPDGVDPVMTLTSRVATKDYAVDLEKPNVPPPADLSAFSQFLRPTRLLPLDGIVKATATEITKGAATDIERARAIYEWIVENTFRDPATRGCGIGDIRFMLETKHLGGKCADLNALFVGLARAVGIPARDVYGLRTAKSARGFKSLGLSSENAARAQHCRAEVYLTGFGWVPVDPADVRKIALEEPPGNLPLNHEKVKEARSRLFGSWEMNWIAFNDAHDVALPGSSHSAIGYFMYPQGETADGRLDSLEPDTFKYSIIVHEIKE